MINKRFLVVAAVVWLLGTITVQAQAARWAGADNLPVSPLDCGLATADQSASVSAKATDSPYDGGQPTNAPALAGQPIRLMDIPKLVNVGYFASTTRGEQEAAAELGNVTVTTAAPAEADINQQINYIGRALNNGVNGILFSANDPLEITPTLRHVLSLGIHVVGYDADSTPGAREWFVTPVAPNGMGKALIDRMAAAIGSSGAFAIITSTLLTPTTGRYIAEMQAYQEKCYPALRWLETVEGQADPTLDQQLAATLIDKYGDQLNGLFGLTLAATPAESQAVQNAQQCSQIAVVGLALVNAMKPYFGSGCAQAVVLWNPVDLGYAAVYVMRAAVDGTLQPGAASVAAGRLGTLRIVNGSDVLLGAPYSFDSSNIDNFDF